MPPMNFRGAFIPNIYGLLPGTDLQLATCGVTEIHNCPVAIWNRGYYFTNPPWNMISSVFFALATGLCFFLRNIWAWIFRIYKKNQSGHQRRKSQTFWQEQWEIRGPFHNRHLRQPIRNSNGFHAPAQRS